MTDSKDNTHTDILVTALQMLTKSENRMHMISIAKDALEIFAAKPKDQQPSGDVEKLIKYVTDSVKESESIYGPIKRISQYGGSIFAIFEKGCYRLNWQSYNNDNVTLDTQPIKEDTPAGEQ